LVSDAAIECGRRLNSARKRAGTQRANLFGLGTQGANLFGLGTQATNLFGLGTQTTSLGLHCAAQYHNRWNVFQMRCPVSAGRESIVRGALTKVRRRN
jgi:hypothetical protein